ncbi:Methionyl-tRNA formyltransferase [Coniosporium apollinis]|uniref:methionyl-tRNA formyltransferase n=1 Tax=Coniosporium apollinis TaxID=61459 RepID=A0ABQ9NX13_9PEZI|nr:Methionyl-tRNA formyltransferase [Coniosporium apollinis]
MAADSGKTRPRDAPSLRAVDEARKNDPELIASVDVACRPGKRTGRGLKAIREVPIKRAAEELQLPVHEIDTFTGWKPPTPQNEAINLVIAVSFGLLVPPRILSGAKYGGLNVHPSLLPDLRGPAPIHHTLLQGRKTTGITLQTLHPKHFDQGMILAQTPELDTPHPDACTPKMLIEYLAPLGGRLLVESLKERLFVPPLEDAGWYAREGQKLWHAPKITKQDRHIIWTNSQSTPKPDQHTQSPVTWTAEEILRRDRVLGDLWDTTTYQGLLPEEGKAKRVVFHGWEEVMGDDSVLESLASGDRLEVGVPYVTENSNAPPYLYFKTQDEPPKLVRVTSCTVEGGKRGAGISEMMAIRTRRS